MLLIVNKSACIITDFSSGKNDYWEEHAYMDFQPIINILANNKERTDTAPRLRYDSFYPLLSVAS